jgi:NADH-quinone oxidoreductase subunit C
VETPEQIKSRLEAAVPGAKLKFSRTIVRRANVIAGGPGPCAGGGEISPRRPATAPRLLLQRDRVDWPEAELTEKIKVKQVVDGVEKEIEEVKKTVRPAFSKWFITFIRWN